MEEILAGIYHKMVVSFYNFFNLYYIEKGKNNTATNFTNRKFFAVHKYCRVSDCDKKHEHNKVSNNNNLKYDENTINPL